jgi:AraC family transcriptional regulator
MLRPGKVRMHSIGEGGVLTVLRCRFDHNTFAAMTALSDWDARRLRQCAALRSKSLMALARRVQREVAAPGFSSEIAIAAYADLMMIEIGRLFHDRREPKARGGLAPWQLARIDEMMRAAHGAWPNVGEMAAACGVSRSHLSRAFAQATGVTLAAHAEALRLERAKALMGRSGVSMSAVAAELGFATPSAFGAAFRRATGQSPLRYARLLRRQ